MSILPPVETSKCTLLGVWKLKLLLFSSTMGHHSSFDCCVSEVLQYVIHFGIVHSEPSILGYPHDYGNLWIETHFLSPGARLYPTESHAMHWAASQALQGHKALGAPAKKRGQLCWDIGKQATLAISLTLTLCTRCYVLFHTISNYFILFHTISYYFILVHTISYYFILFLLIYVYIVLYRRLFFFNLTKLALASGLFCWFLLHAFAYFEGKPELGGMFSWLLLGCLFAWSSSLWWKMLVDVG